MTAEEESGMPDNYVEVSFHWERRKTVVVGYVEDVVLSMYAEGKIRNIPLLTVENRRLVLVYYAVEGVVDLRAYPTYGQLDNTAPSPTSGLLDEVDAATDRLDENMSLPAVPIAGDEDAD